MGVYYFFVPSADVIRVAKPIIIILKLFVGRKHISKD